MVRTDFRPSIRWSASTATPSRCRSWKAPPTSRRSSSREWPWAVPPIASSAYPHGAVRTSKGRRGMRPYFDKMASFGKELKENRIARTKESRAKLEAVEAEIAAARKAKENVGLPADAINKRGWLTVWQRPGGVVEAGTWQPLDSL